MKIRKISMVVIIIMLLSGCSSNSYIVKYDNDTIASSINVDIVENMIDKSLVNHKISNVTLTAVGDIMFHKWQLYRGYDKETDSFDFTNSFRYVEEYLKNSDYTIGNLETTLAGRNKGRNIRPENEYKGYHGFPCFNTPEILAYNMKKAGFDLLSTANNHSLDSKAEGVISTLDFLDKQGLAHVGTYRNEDEADKIFTTDINDMKFAFLAYTYGTNGFDVPKDKPYLINSLGMYDRDKIDDMISEVKRADETGVDFVVTIIHFGNEYFDYPNSYQKDIVDELFEAGTDVIIGSHPHVLQPLEIRDIKCDDGSIRKGVVIYSLGNFLSSQRYTKQYPSQTDVSVIMDINFEKIDNHRAEIKSISFVPTCTFRNSRELAVLPVDEILDNIDSYNLDINEYGINRLNYARANTIKHILTYTDKNYIYNNYKYTISLH
ncbi:CapA family protein [Vallitalea sp.]|jgi:poly-gamma-glutamate synthesis protein (capsule biosynthesis protein)|uniref:CapA family protein n=1 Tax=Vallitalea sp. TaxID=1882829 RepID=UPI0025E46B16|nr:CapA family protein [Vallitalea sp.]MCT4688343.1 CapA family protein [Vallitalea sp.]